MNTISTDNNTPLVLLDQDVLAGATARSLVYGNAEGTHACAVELRVTLLGAQPVNLALRVLGQNSAPASDSTRLLVLNVAVPVTTALAADYAAVFVLPVFTPWSQLEVQNVSGGNVHVTMNVQGCDAGFAGTAASATAATVVLGAGSANAGTVQLGTAAQTDLDSMTGYLLTLAGAIASGSMKTALQAGANAIGKLTANAGVIIGDVNVVALPSLVLAAGTAAIGKLAANASGVLIGMVEVALPTTGASGQGTVTTPGVSVTLGAAATLVEGITIWADEANAGYLYVYFAASSGDRRTTGAKLGAGKPMFVPILSPAVVQIDAAGAGYGYSYAGT
jgi:hypothetical protein